MMNNTLKLNVGRTIMVGLAFFTITMFWEVYDSLMPLFLADFGINFFWRGVVMALDNVLALVLLPFMGLLSDRFPSKLRSKFGRRIPFIVVGSVLAAVMFLLLNYAHNARMLPLMLVATAFVLVFMCLYRTPAVSLMPDVTPKPIRSKANAVINIMGTVGGVVTLLLMTFLLKKEKIGDEFFIVGNNWILIIIISSLMVLSALIMVLKVKENKLVELRSEQMKACGIEEEEVVVPVKSKSRREVLGQLSKPQLRSLFWILASVFLWYMAYNGIKTHYSAFSLNVLGEGNFTVPLLIANVAGFIMFIPSSIIGAKIGRKKTVMIGVVMLIAGFAFGAVLLLPFLNIPMSVVRMAMYPTFILVGGGWATINVHSYVMSVELADESNTGVFTGLYYTFAMGAQIITPILAGLCMDLSPELLLVYGVIFAVAALITMKQVRHGNATTLPIGTNE